MERVTKPLVTIRCITYNHEPYIRQCLDGFIMKKKNFRFEAIVHDDASTDGTADIIREYAEKYPEIIKPILQTENQYSKRDGSIRKILNENTHGKYIAICEGDDYWIDPLKLQKQVDFLENNESYGLVFGKSIYYIQKDNVFLDFRTDGNVGSTEKLLSGNCIETLTTLFRKNIYDKYHSEINREWLMGDYPLWIYISIHFKIHFTLGIAS